MHHNFIKIILLIAGLTVLASIVLVQRVWADKRLDGSCGESVRAAYEKKKEQDRKNPGEKEYFDPKYCFSGEMNACLYVGGYQDDKKWQRGIFDAKTNEMIAPIFDYLNKADRPTDLEFTSIIDLKGGTKRFWKQFRQLCG